MKKGFVSLLVIEDQSNPKSKSIRSTTRIAQIKLVYYFSPDKLFKSTPKLIYT